MPTCFFVRSVGPCPGRVIVTPWPTNWTWLVFPPLRWTNPFARSHRSICMRVTWPGIRSPPKRYGVAARSRLQRSPCRAAAGRRGRVTGYGARRLAGAWGAHHVRGRGGVGQDDPDAPARALAQATGAPRGADGRAGRHRARRAHPPPLRPGPASRSPRCSCSWPRAASTWRRRSGRGSGGGGSSSATGIPTPPWPTRDTGAGSTAISSAS